MFLIIDIWLFEFSQFLCRRPAVVSIGLSSAGMLETDPPLHSINSDPDPRCSAFLQ